MADGTANANANAHMSAKSGKRTFDWKSQSRWWERPFVQVIKCDVKTGACYTPTYKGMLKVSEKELEYRPALAESPIDLEKMRLEMKEYAAKYMEKCLASGKDPGEYIPLPIQKYVFLRSGGFCEFPGCQERGERIHHLKRKSIDPDCDPDGLGEDKARIRVDKQYREMRDGSVKGRHPRQKHRASDGECSTRSKAYEGHEEEACLRKLQPKKAKTQDG